MIALADLPDWPRLLSLKEAARYVGEPVTSFKKAIGDLWPEPIQRGGRKLFDKDALDRAVDRLSHERPTSSAKKIGEGWGRAGDQTEAH